MSTQLPTKESSNPDLYRTIDPIRLDSFLADTLREFPRYVTWLDFFALISIELRELLRDDECLAGLARDWTPAYRFKVGGDAKTPQRVVEFGQRQDAQAFFESPYAYDGTNPTVYTISADGSDGDLIACITPPSASWRTFLSEPLTKLTLARKQEVEGSVYTPIMKDERLGALWQRNGTLSLAYVSDVVFSVDFASQMLRFLAEHLTVGVGNMERDADTYTGNVRDALTGLAAIVEDPRDFLDLVAEYGGDNATHFTLCAGDTIFAIYAPDDENNATPRLSSYVANMALMGADKTVRRIDIGTYTGEDTTHAHHDDLDPADFSWDDTLYQGF